MVFDEQINVSLIDLLSQLERTMRLLLLWQESERSIDDIPVSNEPFYVDILAPEQWLQWIFIPKMRQLIKSDLGLPSKIAITPYFEQTLSDEYHQQILPILQAIDDLLNSD